MNRNSLVAGVISLRLDGQGFVVRFPAGARYFSLLQELQLGSAAHLSFFSVVTFDSCAKGLKQLGREADHLPPPSANVKNAHTSID